MHNGHSPKSCWEITTAFCTIVTALCTFGLLVVGIYAIHIAKDQIREMHDEQQANTLRSVVTEFDSKEMRGTESSLACKRLKGGHLIALDPDNPPVELVTELNFFETVGLLTRRKALNLEDVHDTFGYWIVSYYADAKPYIEAEQKADPAGGWFIDFVQLESEMRAIDKQRGATGNVKTISEVEEFYREGCTPGPPPHQRRRKTR